MSSLPENLEFLKKCDDEGDGEESGEDRFMSMVHHSFGQALRNEWYLWWFKDHKYETWPIERPKIVEWFNDRQIYHADDMSTIILITMYRKYFDRPVELDEQIKRYHDFWIEQTGSINFMDEN